MFVHLAAILWGLGLLLATSQLSAQTEPNRKYIFPVPGSKGITGTFGEMRFAHFHSGLDISTYASTGLRILAARDGYIHRIRIASDGYGRCLFIKHADGYSTVYAHLERFAAHIESRVRRQQLATRSFPQDLFFGPQDFPVVQGEIIGYSGNTGNSGGPHLHFEIRDPEENPTNPLAYFTDYIEDDLPPTLHHIAFQTLAPHSRVQGTWGSWIEKPQHSENVYYASDTLVLHGPIGVGYVAYDKLNGTRNVNGHYETKLYLDDHLVYSHSMDKFAFSDMLKVHLHCDFHYKVQEQDWLQRCYRVPGNNAPIYGQLHNNGILHATDTSVHLLRLFVKDKHGNVASYTRKLRWSDSRPRSVPQPHAQAGQPPQAQLWGKVLLVHCPPLHSPASLTVRYASGVHEAATPTYRHPDRDVFVFALKPDRLPLSLRHPGWQHALETGLLSAALPGKITHFRHQGLRGTLPAGAVTDTAYIAVNTQPTPLYGALSPLYKVGDAGTALFARAQFSIQPEKPGSKLGCVEPRTGKRPSWKGRADQANSLTLGNWCVLPDHVPPTIRPRDFVPGRPLRENQSAITFDVVDNLDVNPSSVQLTIDGKWAVGEYYDYNNYCVHWLDPLLPPGEHVAELRAADMAGNVQVQRYVFITRE